MGVYWRNFAVAPIRHSQDTDLLAPGHWRITIRMLKFGRCKSLPLCLPKRKVDEEEVLYFLLSSSFFGITGDWTQGQQWDKFPTFYFPKEKKRKEKSLCMCEHVHLHLVCAEVKEQLRRGHFFSFHQVGPWDQTQASGFKVDFFTLWTLSLARYKGKKEETKETNNNKTNKKERKQGKQKLLQLPSPQDKLQDAIDHSALILKKH